MENPKPNQIRNTHMGPSLTVKPFLLLSGKGVHYRLKEIVLKNSDYYAHSDPMRPTLANVVVNCLLIICVLSTLSSLQVALGSILAFRMSLHLQHDKICES